MNGAIKAALAWARVEPLAEADAAEWRAGWRIVMGAAIGLGTGIALYLLVASLFVKKITAEFGWSRGDLSAAGAGAFLVAAVALPLIGLLLDRVGYRRVLLVCVPAIALTYLGLTLVNGSFAAYVAILVFGGIVGGGTGAMVYTRPVIAAFNRQRGLALGLSASGTSLASLAFAPVVAFLIGEYGWRAGAYGLIVVTLFLGLPAALALLGRARDTAFALPPDLPPSADFPPPRAVEGARGDRVIGDTVIPAAAAGPNLTLGEARTRARFWLILFALVAVNVPGSGVVGQLGPLVTDKGLSDAASGAVLSFYAAGLLIGRVATGFALDRMSAVTVAAVTTSIPVIGMLLLLSAEPSFALAAFAAALIGLQQGSEIDLLAFFVSRAFGFAHYGAIYGAIAMAGALATAVGIILFGEMHDQTKSYDQALIIGAACFAAGAVCFAALGRVK